MPLFPLLAPVELHGYKPPQPSHPRARAPAPPRPHKSTPSTPETIVSPKEAKELFSSVDEILKFASEDTELPIKHKVKRKLMKRDEVQPILRRIRRG